MSRPGIWILGAGAVLIFVGCGAAGMILSQPSGPGRANLAEVRSKLQVFEANPTAAEAPQIADMLVTLNTLHPGALEFDKGTMQLLIPTPQKFWERLIHSTSRSFEGISIKDSDGNFARRWRDLEPNFVSVYHSAGAVRRGILFGQVTLSRRTGPTSSSNPLDYLDFSRGP